MFSFTFNPVSTLFLWFKSFEREAPGLKGQLPSSLFFLKCIVLRLFWLKRQTFFQVDHTFYNAMWKSWLLVMKLVTCVAPGTVYRNTWLGNTIKIFVIKQICWTVLLDIWWNMLIIFSKQIGNGLTKIINTKMNSRPC